MLFLTFMAYADLRMVHVDARMGALVAARFKFHEAGEPISFQKYPKSTSSLLLYAGTKPVVFIPLLQHDQTSYPLRICTPLRGRLYEFIVMCHLAPVIRSRLYSKVFNVDLTYLPAQDIALLFANCKPPEGV